MSPVKCRATIQRKQPGLPRFIVVQIDLSKLWKITGTITVSGTINDVPLGRRGLKAMGDGTWFIDLPEPLCRKAKADTGDRVELVIQPVADAVPAELTSLLNADSSLMAAWQALTPGRRRQAAEWVAGASQATTRERRASSVATHLSAAQGCMGS